jgi:hypothetical protein
MSLADAFADIALGFSGIAGAPFHEADVISVSAPVYDDGGDIVTPGTPTRRSCMAQADYAGEAMRGEAGFADGDIRILILSATLSGAITTDDRVEIKAGPFAGLWSVQSVSRDPAAVGFELRGRRG